MALIEHGWQTQLLTKRMGDVVAKNLGSEAPRTRRYMRTSAHYLPATQGTTALKVLVRMCVPDQGPSARDCQSSISLLSSMASTRMQDDIYIVAYRKTLLVYRPLSLSLENPDGPAPLAPRPRRAGAMSPAKLPVEPLSNLLSPPSLTQPT